MNEGTARLWVCDGCPHGPCYLETPAGIPPQYREHLTAPFFWCPRHPNSTPAEKAAVTDFAAMGAHLREWVCRACPRGPCAFYGGEPTDCPVIDVPASKARGEEVEA